MSSMLDEIDAVATPNMVVIGAGQLMNKQPKYHKPAFDGAMTGDCSSFGERQNAQRLERRHAVMQGFDPCQRCFDGDRL